MDPYKEDIVYNSRFERNSQKKVKKKSFWKLFWIGIVIIFLSLVIFVYGTKQGLHIRKMLVGSVLSSQHSNYVKYMRFLLPQSDINTMVTAYKEPPTFRTAIIPKSKPLPQPKKKEKIHIDTVETKNYTAKIMVIPDPTTVHLVETRLASKGQALSELIKENHGVAGINAGGFVDPGGNGSGGRTVGIVISNGKLLASLNGNKNASELIGGFLKDGQFITGNYSANELLQKGVTQAVSFRPQLIVNGKSVVTPAINSAWGWAPRTAIGQETNGTVVMIITDGRFYWNKTHRGASMSDLAKLFESYHVENAMAMDGGGSTTMIKDGKLLLKPATNTRVGMRYLPNAWVVIPK